MAAIDGILKSSKAAGAHAIDAMKGAAVAGKDLAVSANSRLAGNIAEKGVWGTMKHGARQYPLVVGAAAITGAYVVGTKVMGPRESDIRMKRAAAQEQGMSR